MITFYCKDCRERIVVDDSKAGKAHVCPLCGASLRVPAEALVVVPPPPPQPSPPKPLRIPTDLDTRPIRIPDFNDFIELWEVDPTLQHRIDELRGKKKNSSLTPDEALELKRLYAERKQHVQQAQNKLWNGPRPVILPGCDHGHVRRGMDPDEKYPIWCRARMKTYSSLRVCLDDCAGKNGPGVNPCGKPCNCIIDPGARTSIDPEWAQRFYAACEQQASERGRTKRWIATNRKRAR